jgi:3-hydroxybutyrate dehydrogenase
VVNLGAAFHATRLVIPGMRAAGWGRIVNIASTHGLVASPLKVPYVASKHGLVGLTRGTALEVAPWGITCNAVCPGFTRTAMFDLQAEGLAAAAHAPVEEVVAEQVGAKQAIAQVIETDEIAAVVAFLCTDGARSITGAALPVDGGWTAQ